MAESARESESNDEDNTSVMSTEFTSLPSESEFSAVIFNNVPECYPPDRDIECRYTIKNSVKPNSRDWIGLFKVGWQSSREHYTYEWSPMPNIQDGEQGRPIANRVVFRLRYLPKADDEFYQFCYVTYASDVRGASVPFQIKTKPIEQEELECCEIEDDEGSSIMIVKNKTAMLEESLARALEENAALKASNETALADLATANDKVMESESRKAELTAALKETEKKICNLEQALAQKNLALEELQGKRRDLESTNSDLKTMQENLNRRVDELMMMLEQERVQTSQQVEKNMEKLVIERKQYLENMAADREMIEKLQNDLKAKEDESNALKSRWMEFKTKARSESSEFAEKIEKVNSENGRLQEQLLQITEENNILKRNLEEESERLTKKVRDMYIELKNKDQEREKVQEEIASYLHRIEELESTKEEILRDASHEAELLGQKIQKLQRDLTEKQELIHQLEQELEDANSQLEQEKGKITALEEDYESVIRALHDQLEGEKALNQSLCSQSDRNVASLQGQVQKQLEANMELSQQLEGKNAELRDVCGELNNYKKQLQYAEEKLQIALVQLAAIDAEVKSLKLDKETLQTTLTDTQGASAQSTKNSAASMYALQTAHTHLEKKYLKAKKEMDELWRERNELKRTIATFQGNVPCDDLRLQMEEMRACNEDLRVRLNMGAEAFKMKFIECRQLEEQLNKVTRTSSVQSEEAGSATEMRNKISKLRRALDEEKKALNIEKSMVLQKDDEINQVCCKIQLTHFVFSWKVISHSVGCLISVLSNFLVMRFEKVIKKGSCYTCLLQVP